ncbi:AraC family transcriptional regulator [Emticicia sp. TH156]|uniref:helix-turn-helix domain-containing protein n=1 Tax=Emticicia sp. TH156 TaxID=2067454 RepID=UPI000C778590|nr:helix-turn-helix domain-containing protein [Emticicia sp. TH156]PLK44013.1 AraC family transcriptional regulator [Emticicia sp. TH156]
MLIYDTIRKYSVMFNNPILHPLINVVDLSKSPLLPKTRFMLAFYAVIIKETRCGDIRYGNQYYDYDNGTIVFFGPGQVITHEPEGEMHQPYGTALIFHPDLIRGTSLVKYLHQYSFFSYQTNEALHVSEKERTLIDGCLANIEAEISQNLDKHSRTLIVANIELLLKYCSRFYDRQFYTRENVNRGLIGKFEQLLADYLTGEKLKTKGLPSVAYFADLLHLSPNYFGDLVKKETGKTALEFIQLRLLEVAKERILDHGKSLSEISYELGFRYPQHFTRFFKQKTGVTPIQYRMH